MSAHLNHKLLIKLMSAHLHHKLATEEAMVKHVKLTELADDDLRHSDADYS